jgi:hypothetical protein
VELVVLVVEEAVVLMATVIKVLEEQVVNLMVLQQLQVEKLPVDRVDKIQEVVGEALGTTKQQGVGVLELSILDILQITP